MSRVHSINVDHTSFAHVRRQASAGQGGFHVGGLLRRPWATVLHAEPGYDAFTGCDVLYVYDCGSEPKRHVQHEIRTLLATQPDRHLDILALSHFDRDHICGVPHLLDAKIGFKTVDTVLLPYVDDAERLIAMGKAVAGIETHGGRIPSFFTEMVIDPVRALGDLGLRRIVLVRGEDDGGPDGLPAVVPEEGPHRDPDWLSGRGEAGVTWRPKQARGDRPWMFTEPFATPGLQLIWASNVMLVGANADGSLMWKLRPYTRPAKLAEIAQFKAAVEGLFGWLAGTFDPQVKSTTVRRQMVTSHRTKLATAYQAAFKDKNLTSMSLYSGPLEPATFNALSLAPGLPAHDLTKVGWLGTGDAHLNLPPDRQAFVAAYAADLPVTSTFVFPHHGSIENTDPADLVSEADEWVAAADPIHDWEHPHWRLHAAVSAKGARFRHVRAAAATAFEEVFLLTPVAGPK